jgi:eukaryotic-like serine/threonine-protein kinase
MTRTRADEHRRRDEAELSSGGEFEKRLAEFEAAWLAGAAPCLAEFITAHGDGSHELAELVAIDLEFRWRLAAGMGSRDLPARARIEDYLARWPQLAEPAGPPAWLIGEEYRVRRLWGDRPGRPEFLSRFAAERDKLDTLLGRVELELGREETSVVTLLTAAGAGQQHGAGREPRSPRGDFPVVPGIEILDTIARGGMGIVYKGRQTRLNRWVAVKMVLAGRHATDEERARFRLEAESAARIKHPNIAHIYEVGEIAEQPFQVLEFVDGLTLQKLLETTRLSARSAARLIEVLARAIAVAHQNGVVHRDLKPSNVLVPHEALAGDLAVNDPAAHWDAVKIVDFGLAKRIDTAQLHAIAGHAPTLTGALLGTPCYMAPEQAGGRPDSIGPAADIHALGAMLYELLVGQPPFRGESLAETLDQVRSREPTAPRKIFPGVPQDLETICLKCLHKDPRRRYTTAFELALDLARFQAREPIQARPVTAGERLLLWAQRRPALAILAASCTLLALAALVGGVYYSLSLRAALKLAAIRGQQAEHNFLDALETVRQSLLILGNERLAPVPEVEEARRDALSAAAVMLDRLAGRRASPEPALEHERARTYVGMGRIQVFLGRYHDAERSYRQALAILDELRRRAPRDRSVVREIANVQVRIVESLHTPTVDVQEREARCERAIALLEELAREEPSTNADLAAAHMTGGTIVESKHRFAHLTRAVELYEELAATQPADYRPSLARAVYNLAGLKRETGDAARGETLLRRSLSIWRSIPAEQLDDSQRLLLAECYSTLGAVLLRPTTEAGGGEAGAMASEGLKIREQMALRQPRVYSYRDGLSRAYNIFALALAEAGRRPEALTYLEKAATTRQAIIRDFPHLADEPLFLAEVLVNQAAFLCGMGETARAIDVASRSVDLLDAQARLRPSWARVHFALSKACQNMALSLRVAGKPSQALVLHDRSIAEFESAAKLPSDSSADREQGATIRAARAVTYEALHQFPSAASDWRAARDLSDRGNRSYYTALLARALAQAGDYEGMARAVVDMAAGAGAGGETNYNLACAYSLAINGVDRDARLDASQKQTLRARFIAEAIKHLTHARDAGLFDAPEDRANLGADPDLAALRPDPRFAQFRGTLRP